MQELVSCERCGGFSPAERATCVHCGRGGLIRRIAGLVGGGALMLTLMACYGKPPHKGDCIDKDGDGFCAGGDDKSAKSDCDDGDPKVHDGCTK